MGFQLSPGINISEIDLTTIVPAVSTTEGAIAGVFSWGPVLDRELVSSEIDLQRRFGKPIVGFNQETFFTAADFLAYGNALHVVRVSDGNTAVVDVGPSSPVGVAANTDHSGTALADLSAKYPGTYGNTLKVSIVNQGNFANSTFEAFFDDEPESNNNVHVLVLDEDGVFTGTNNAILERYSNISLTEGALLEDGTNNFLVDVINERSTYLKFANTETSFATTVKTYFDTHTTEYVASLTGGTNGSNEAAIAQADLRAGYEMFKSSEEVDVSLILMGKAVGTSHKAELANYVIQNIAEYRKDCVVFISPDKADTVDTNTDPTEDVVAFRTGVVNGVQTSVGLTSSSYAVLDSGHKKRYDKYNDVYTWTPLNGDTAGLCVRTDNLRDAWWSPAGYNRGIIKNVTKLAYNPNKTQRDALYKKGVNPVITEPGQGTLLFGDKTLLAKPSAFDRINVRRLFIVLEKAIAVAAKYTLFEFNDEFTRSQFVNLVEPFLRDVQGRRGITDFRVVCDETNNTPEIIDRNEFVGDIYIKPARSINFIQLNFIAVRTGVEFEEIVGKF